MPHIRYRPDFLLVGMPYRGKVLLVASADIDSMDIEMNQSFIDITEMGDTGRSYLPGPPEHKVSAVMRQLSWLEADHYPQALERLHLNL